VTVKGLRRDRDSPDDEWAASNEVEPAVPATDAESTAPPDEWKVNVEGREIVGMPASEIVLKLRSGELSGRTLAWRDGMGEWTALDALPVFALAAPQSSRPAASESRPKVTEDAATEDVTVARAPQVTEIGLQPPPAPVSNEAPDDGYDPEDATKVRSMPDVPLEEATVILRDPETLPPPPDPAEEGAASARGDDLAGALAVYERPVATLAFADMDAASDEKTIVSDPPESSSDPPAPPSARPKAEEPPVPPLPKLPSRALVSTAAATFLPPSQPPPRAPSGARRLSSLGPATGNRPSSPSSPSIGLPPSLAKKPLVPSTSTATSTPAPLVEALLSLTGKTETPSTKPAAEGASPAPQEPAPSAKVSSTPPAPPSAKVSATPPAPPSAKVSATPPASPSAKVSTAPPMAPSENLGSTAPGSPSATAKAPSAPPIRVKREEPVVKMEPAIPAKESPPSRFVRQHTPAETPFARASERPAPLETPTPAAGAVTESAARVATPPPEAATATPADVAAAVLVTPLPVSDPASAQSYPPPPPLPKSDPPEVGSGTGRPTPTIILREDRNEDTLITNLRLARSVPVRTAVAGGAVSTLVGSLITGLIVSSMQPEPPKPAPPVVVTVTAAPVPPPAPEPPKPAVEPPAATTPSAGETTVPQVSARELAAEKKTDTKPKKAWTPPKPKPTLADPEVALPDSPPSPATERAPGEKSPTANPETSDPAADKNKPNWETSPGF
jgi:hypothetical protein